MSSQLTLLSKVLVVFTAFVAPSFADMLLCTLSEQQELDGITTCAVRFPVTIANPQTLSLFDGAAASDIIMTFNVSGGSVAQISSDSAPEGPLGSPESQVVVMNFTNGNSAKLLFLSDPSTLDGSSDQFFLESVTQVPEPSTIKLLGIGALASISALRRRHLKRAIK
jgi:hypothetical protein